MANLRPTESNGNLTGFGVTTDAFGEEFLSLSVSIISHLRELVNYFFEIFSIFFRGLGFAGRRPARANQDGDFIP